MGGKVAHLETCHYRQHDTTCYHNLKRRFGEDIASEEPKTEPEEDTTPVKRVKYEPTS
jgi:hypothetical protein